MPNNLERFSLPESMRRRELEEGIFENEESAAEIAEQTTKKAAELIDLFRSEEFQQGGTKGLKEALADLPKNLRLEVSRQWLGQDTEQGLRSLEGFGPWPDSFQKDLGTSLRKVHLPHWFAPFILENFGSIRDRGLRAWLVQELNMSELVENRSKFPDLTDEQILEKAPRHPGRYSQRASFIEWTSVIPYIDALPTLDKNLAIKGVFEQPVNRQPEILMKHREKIGLSERQVIDLCTEHKEVWHLASVLDCIDPSYHQEIADKTLQEGQAHAVTRHANAFKNVDVPKLIDGIVTLGQNQAQERYARHKKSSQEVVLDALPEIAQAWGTYIAPEMVAAMAQKNPGRVAAHMAGFGENLDKERLTELLFEHNAFSSLCDHASQLGFQCDTTLANKIVDKGGTGALFVAEHAHRFQKLPRAVYLRVLELLESDNLKASAYKNIEGFEGLTREDAHIAVLGLTSNSQVVDKMIHTTNAYNGLGLDQNFADVLLQGGHVEILAKNLDRFTGVDVIGVAKSTMEAGQAICVLKHLDAFPGLNHRELADKACEQGKGYELVARLDRLTGLDHREVARKFLAVGDVGTLARYFQNFHSLNEDRSLGQDIFDAYRKVGYADIGILASVSEAYIPPLDKSLTLAHDLLGDHLTIEGYTTVRSIKDGSASAEDMRILGIAKLGEAGLLQLRERLVRFRSELLEPMFDVSILHECPFYADYFKSYVRFKNSAWGEHDEDSFENMVNTHLRLKHENKILALGEAYAPSGEISIDRIDKETQESFEYSEQFLNRYEVLRRSLSEALELLHEEKPLTRLVEKCSDKLDGIVQELESKLRELTDPNWQGPLQARKINTTKAVESLNQRIAKLRAVDLRNVKNFQEHFLTLAQFPEFHEELRQLTFYYALQKHETARGPMERLGQRQGSPSFDEVGTMVNFIGHIVNQETWRKIFTNKRALKTFQDLTNVKALEEEFVRAQQQSSKGTASMEFVPTRGILMEFSGHIADACWASKYESLARALPNFSAVSMVQNKGTKHERLAGASMLIETEAEDDTKLLVIRGLNPLENVINGLSVKDFFEKFANYIRTIAKKTGRKPAIVIDDHSGGSSTNRPALFGFLEERSKALTRVVLKSKADTTFNEYNIVNNVYLL